MRRILFHSALVAASLASLAALPARAQRTEGPYFGIDAGAAFVQDMQTVLVDPPSRLRLHPGFRLSLAPGYTLASTRCFDASVQFETGFIYNSLDRLRGDDFDLSADGEYWQVPFLGDIIYTFHLGRFVPYLGVGGGGVYGRLNLDSIDGEFFGARSHGTDPAFQAMAGFRLKLDERNELGVGYKFLATFPDQIDYIGTHSVSVVYVLRF